jgi:hypothetical protein
VNDIGYIVGGSRNCRAPDFGVKAFFWSWSSDLMDLFSYLRFNRVLLFGAPIAVFEALIGK